MIRLRWLLLAAAALALPLPAPTCSTCLPRFGWLDLVSGDTLRLNLVHVPRPGSLRGTCTVQASIVSPAACLDCLPLAGPATMTLNPNQSFGLEFAAGGGQTARPVVVVLGETENACAGVQASVEVFDAASGRTRLLHTGQNPDPIFPLIPPDPFYPLAGLTSADRLRMHVFYIPPDPIVPAATCLVRAAIEAPPASCIDLCSPAVLNEKTVALTPGQSFSVEYSGSFTGRKMVRPAIQKMGAAGHCANVITTVQMLDTTSGRTFVLAPEGPPTRGN